MNDITKSGALPKLAAHQVIWIFDAAREHFAESVRNLQLEVLRLRAFPESAPTAERSWINMKKPATELIEDKLASIERYLPVIEFCEAARQLAADRSAEEFAKAFAGQFNFGKKGEAK